MKPSQAVLPLANNARRPTEPVVALILPCYNECELLATTHRSLCQSVNGVDVQWRFFYVDDGSTDDTWRVLCDLQSDDDRVGLLRLSRNFGHQYALTAGIDHVCADAVILLDVDLQDPPEVILQFIRLWQQGFDVVYGRRIYRLGEARIRLMLTKIFYWLATRWGENYLVVEASDFRLLDRKVIRELRRMREDGRYIRGLVQWLGFSQCQVDYVRQPRVGGVSKFSWAELCKLALDALFSFGRSPFLAIVASALAVTGAGVCLSLASIFGISTTWTTNFQTGLILILQMFCLLAIAIAGEYLRRLYKQGQGRPLYVVDRFIPPPMAIGQDGDENGARTQVSSPQARTGRGA